MREYLCEVMKVELHMCDHANRHAVVISRLHMSQEVGVLGVSHECVAKASNYPYYMRLVSQNYLLCVNT